MSAPRPRQWSVWASMQAVAQRYPWGRLIRWTIALWWVWAIPHEPGLVAVLWPAFVRTMGGLALFARCGYLHWRYMRQ